MPVQKKNLQKKTKKTLKRRKMASEKQLENYYSDEDEYDENGNYNSKKGGNEYVTPGGPSGGDTPGGD
jgi:hypothetical protein